MRLEELATLKNGWLDGKGLAPSEESCVYWQISSMTILTRVCPYHICTPPPKAGLKLSGAGTIGKFLLKLILRSSMGNIKR